MQTFDGLVPLGQTISGTGADGSTLINHDKLGTIVKFPSFGTTSNARGNKARPARSSQITAVLLRNKSGAILYGGRLAQLSRTAGYDPVTAVTGYTVAQSHRDCVLIDPWLNSDGVAANDLFWGIIGGPAPAAMPTTGAGLLGGDIAVGDFIQSGTFNAASTATSTNGVGRISNMSIANATAAQSAYDQAVAVLGKALSAKTTQQTTAGQDVLVEWFIKF